MKNWKKAGIAALCVMSLLAGCGMQDGKDDGNGGKDDTPMDVTLETLREVNDPCVLLAKYDAVTVNIQGTDRDGEVTYTARLQYTDGGDGTILMSSHYNYTANSGPGEDELWSEGLGGLYATGMASDDTASLNIYPVPGEGPEYFLDILPQCADPAAKNAEETLDERSEQMLVRMQDIHSSFKKIYTDLRVNDTKSEEIADSQGNKLVVSDATYSAAMEHPDRAFRKEFFEKLLGTYGGYINTLSSNYYALVKTNVYIAKSRGYCSARNQSLSENFIPEEVYDNLLATVRANTEPFQRYISLRNRVLGLDKSYMYDLFLPIVPDSTKKYSFDEAYELMLKATTILGEDYTALVKRSHEERWCDVYPKQGKVTGAYSTGAYAVHPYMLLNYNGTLDDVFTLLHETGHSMHSYYSDHTQPFIYSDYTLFCAEVASTTNEMLLYHYLLDHAQTKEEKAVLLSKHLNDIRSTFYRQTMFADFENQTHKMVEAGQPLLPDVLCEIHRKINEDYYGPDFVADRFISYEWARIPHFYRAFYVYQYATGISAAVAIANRIRRLGQPAIEDYKNFLRSGSSDHPIELLKIAGVDMASPQPILDIIEDFNQTLKQLEELL